MKTAAFLRRRQFLAGIAALTVGRARSLCAQRPETLRVGAAIGPALQGADVGQRLKTLAAAGCAFAETGIENLIRYASQIADAGIEPTSAFLRTPTVNGNWRVWRASTIVRNPLPPDTYDLTAALDDASKIRGLRNLTVVMLLPEERGTLDDYRRFADVMNIAGDRCQGAGLTLSYHMHSFDYARLDGQVPMELLMQRFDPRCVKFEVDVFWMAMGGWDAIEFIKQHGTRISGLHLKDRSNSAPQTFFGSPWEMPADFSVPLGDGNLDFGALLREATAARIGHNYVEDESAGDRFRNLLKSFAHLKAMIG